MWHRPSTHASIYCGFCIALDYHNRSILDKTRPNVVLNNVVCVVTGSCRPVVRLVQMQHVYNVGDEMGEFSDRLHLSCFYVSRLFQQLS